MASGSPRTRIDQFYASKKRKPISPGLKSERHNKEAVVAAGGSPGTKGTLDGYLVKSQDDGVASLRTDQIKRKLAVDIELSSRKACESEISLSQEHPQKDEGLEVESRGSSGDCCSGTQVPVDDTIAAVPRVDNPELKQFAAHFLSLYCSEVSSSVSSPPELKVKVPKRNGSPSLLSVEENKEKKKQCVEKLNESHVEGGNSISNPGNDKHMTPGYNSKTGEVLLSRLGEPEVTSGNDPTELYAVLRKCNETANSSVGMVECYTPDIFRNKAVVTPKSAHGSSFFSPGESFWNEAIEVADGLNGAFDKVSVRASKELEVINGNLEQSYLCDERSGRHDDMMTKMSSEGEVIPRHMESKTSSGVGDEYEKLKIGFQVATSDKQKSGLPVRHFDFSQEGKTLDESISHQFYEDNMTQKGGQKSDTGHVKVLQTTSVLTRCGKDQKNQLYTSDKKPESSFHMSSSKDPDVPTSGRAKESEVTGMEFIPVAAENEGGLQSLENHSDTSIVQGKDMRSPSISDRKYDESSTPSSSLPVKNSLELSNWLPSQLCSVYVKKGISKLYPWQVDCLMVDGVLQKRNLVYCASTSAGKSFVAEILMLRRVVTTGKIALLVLPYVSICAEKAEHLEVLLEPLGKHVRSFYGNQGGGTLPKDTSVAVCTIEKANFLINRLLEEGRLSEVGIIVIDELHMVGDQSRGYLLELLLTKLRYAVGEGNVESLSGESSGTSSGKADPAHGLQIVGMSATMPNVASVADWLQAALYQTEFRPVPLEEYIKVGNSIFDKKLNLIRTLPRTADLGGKDPDHVIELCNEVVQEGHSVLMFCSSRKGCESTARHISKFLKQFSVSTQDDSSEFGDISSAIDALRRCPVGLDPTLEETLPCGVAYHHAGLTVEEREVVETCYRKGLVRVLTATSTLAAGVNLPARRVIFRQPRIGRDYIDGTRYKQMAGRAGRTGIDTKGESVLICKPEEVKRISSVLNDSCPPLQSCLSEDKNGMTHAILEVVAGGIVQTANDINRYVRCTLLNSTKPFQDVVKSAQDSLRWLCHMKFLEWNEETKLYSTTPLGRASFGSSLSPEESLVVLDDLSRAREGFVLASDLHLVYLVTPINVDVEPDWELFYQRFMELSSLEQSVGNRVGVGEPFLMRMAHGAPMHVSAKSRENKKGVGGRFQKQTDTSNNSILSYEQTLRVCRRFYVALILSRLVQEAPVTDVCEAYKVARGMVQALQENAGRFASMVSIFCERLGWHDLEGLVGKFQNRVSFGVRAEIVELTTIPYVKGSRARALYKAGLRTPQAIAEASISEIVKALFESSSWAAQEGTAHRRIHMGLAKKIKNGARKIVLDKAEEARLAAFSAFKSLGLVVPNFSQPLFATGAGSPNNEDDAMTSSGGDTSLVGIEPEKGFAAKLDAEEGNENSDNAAPQVEGVKSPKISNVVFGTSGEVSSKTSLQCTNAAGNVGIIVEGSTLNAGNEVKSGYYGTDNSRVRISTQIEDAGISNRIIAGNLDLERKDDNSGEGTIIHNDKNTLHDNGPISASKLAGGFDSFLDLWDTVTEFYFDVHFTKRSELNSIVPFEIHGIAICWENSPVYYVNLSKDLTCNGKPTCRTDPEVHPQSTSSEMSTSLTPKHLWQIAKQRWNRIAKIMAKSDARKIGWNLKVQIQVLKNPGVCIHRFGSLSYAQKDMDIQLIDDSFFLLPPIYVKDLVDMCIVSWMLWPDEERSSNPNLEKEVKKRLSTEVAAAANRYGRWKNQMRRVAHNGCCRRVAQTRALGTVLLKLVVSEELLEALISIENPLVNILADMELWGIGVEMEGCLRARQILWKKLKELESEAYKLAGMTFSLSTTADIANVLFGHLKLPIPEGHTKGKQHPSTDKHSLDLLRHLHPIVSVIKEHRTLAKLSNSTLGSICSMSRLSLTSQKYTLHGHWLQTSTATGRLSMEEPNLQCVEHEVKFKGSSLGKNNSNSDADDHIINARDFFIPTQDNWLLLTADYSQIELRLMAHFSKDSSLIQLLTKPNGDVFSMIAARWTGQLESTVSSQERDQTKRLVYGILYGMGPNTLAEQLDCSNDEASHKIQSFKRSFPGVASWLHEAVASCRQKGYITTLKGRKRFLSKIKFGDSKEKGKAQRQAVNSICQGSAADIIKIAMIRIYSVIAEGHVQPDSATELAAKFQMLKGRCRLLLQVHDELVLEVDPSVVREAGLLLQSSMESAASLLVPLHAKLKVGRTWGSLEPFQAGSFEEAMQQS